MQTIIFIYAPSWEFEKTPQAREETEPGENKHPEGDTTGWRVTLSRWEIRILDERFRPIDCKAQTFLRADGNHVLDEVILVLR